MIVRKFYGATTREALRQVRDALGPDALILSNRQVTGGGIEIMAVADADVATLTSLPSAPGKGNEAPPRAPQRVPQPLAVPPAAPAAPARNQQLNRTYAVPLDDGDGGEEVEPAFVIRSNRVSPPPPAKPTPKPADTPVKHTLSDRPNAALRPPPPPIMAPPPAPEVRETQRFDATFPSLAETTATAQVQAVTDPELKAEIGTIMKELKFLRSLMEGQLAGFAWNEMQNLDPTKLEMFRRMLATGFSPALTRQLLNHLPTDYDFDTALKWVNTALLHNLPAVGINGDLVEGGGVFALVGPTGVGKTTTVAKLAARCTLKHGAARVALITTDMYRIGAHDQLRIYGKILGVAVHAVKDETDLQLTLADLADKHLVLIDTVGMSQRDKRVEEQINLLCGNGKQVRRLLLLSATAQGGQLDDVVQRYLGSGLEGVVLTKVDEAMQLGAALDVIIRRRLTLHYVTNGQRVPEDLHLANPLYLIDRALKMGSQGAAHGLKDEEYPVYMAAVSNPLDAVITKRRPARGGGNRG